MAKREFSTNAGPIDALAFDQDGNIYIVETKLYKNPDKRTVVAQALDYGAALWKHLNDFFEFVAVLDAECEQHFGTDFKKKFADFFALEEAVAVHVFERMRDNLNEGKIKFIILMDTMDERLKDLILYVNQNSQFDVYAVQLEYYRFEEYEIVIPKLFGVEVKKHIGVLSSGMRRQWNEHDFLEQAHSNLKENAGVVTALYDYFKNKADKINWGTGTRTGSFSPIFGKFGETISPFTVFSDGKMQVKFNWLHVAKKDIAEPVNRFMRILREETDIQLPEDPFAETIIIPTERVIAHSVAILRAVQAMVE